MARTLSTSGRTTTQHRRLLRLVPLLVLAGIWELSARLGWVDPWLLPPISIVAQRAWQLFSQGVLAPHLLASTVRVLIGFGIAMALALPLGIAMGLLPALDAALDALLSLLRPLSPPPGFRWRFYGLALATCLPCSSSLWELFSAC